MMDSFAVYVIEIVNLLLLVSVSLIIELYELSSDT